PFIIGVTVVAFGTSLPELSVSISSAKKGLYLFGSRVNITEGHLPELFKTKRIKYNLLSIGINKRTRTIRLPLLAGLYKPVDQRSKKLRGCNMSFWREDFLKVNGFNEELVGWGIDDSEMIQRLHNLGIKGKRLRYKGIVYHIYHNEQSKDHIHLNEVIEQDTTKNKVIYINKGVDQYLNN
ncbi:MAG: hypothetical protein EX254_04520, partial [Flavobacteriaceae bacterium]